jgi:ATP-dependent DNA ligase
MMAMPKTRQIVFPFPPMEAREVDALPEGGQWQYEPKWDGFRCLVFRTGEDIRLQSKSGQPLDRYFPEVVAHVRAFRARRFVLDGELVLPVKGRVSFDDLLQRIHPAASRVRRLSHEFPATLVVFDLLSEGAQALLTLPLADRRARLERFMARERVPAVVLTPVTRRRAEAARWLSGAGGALDGVIAKRTDVAYASGERTGMVKVKRHRTADCVVGGFRYGTGSKLVGSLLLGLYDGDVLHHVGFTSGLKASDKAAVTRTLEALKAEPGFTGRAPGGPSRWSTERSGQWQPLAPKLVVEVEYDHFSQDRFRHGTRLIRWRPDKAARQCTFDQVRGRSMSAAKWLRPTRS